MSGRLAGKVALVTGAAQGIGQAIATMMVQEGAEVMFSDSNAEGVAAAAAAAGGQALAHDVSDPESWAAVARAVSERWGLLDILVNNAGIEGIGPVRALTLESWRRVMAVNLEGTFLGCRAMHAWLHEAGTRNSAGSSVINISSVAGLVGLPLQTSYSAAKAAVRQLTQSLAIEWPQTGSNIRVNSIHPGAIRTPLLKHGLVNARELMGGNDPWAALLAAHPIGRIGRASDVAYGAVYLASDEASFVTGSALVIDGGYTAQ